MPAIEIRGLRELRSKLGNMENVNDVIRQPMNDALALLQRRMMTYPPQRPTWYVRTNTLKRRWLFQTTETTNGIRGILGNNTEYAPLVQSAQMQARVHHGHWQTDRQVVTEEEPRIRELFERAINEALER